MVRTEFVMEDQGIGVLPSKIPSIGSLLLFNSDINPYKNYQALDNLLSTGRFVRYNIAILIYIINYVYI
jgi:hypothetical protein